MLELIAAVACLQEPGLAELVERLRGAESVEARDRVQEDVRTFLRTRKELRAEAARRADHEADVDVKARLRAALAACRWREAGRLPLEKGVLYRALALGDTVMVWGGGKFLPDKKAWEYPSVAWILDPAKGEWTKAEPPPIAWRREPVVTTVAGRVVLWGGYRGYPPRCQTFTGDEPPPEAYEERTELYDGAIWDGKSWTKMPALPFEPSWDESRWTSKGLFLWGGTKDEGAVWDAAANAWTKLPAAPIAARYRHHCVVAGERVWIGGGGAFTGAKGGKPFRDAAVWDGAKGAWGKVTGEVPEDAREVLAVGDRVVVLAGRATSAYDPAADRWTALGEFPLEGYIEHLHAGGDRLHVSTASENGTMRWAVLDARSGRWSELPAPSFPPRFGATWAWMEGRVIVWGGRPTEDDGTRPEHEDGAVFDFARGAWTPVAFKGVPGARPAVVQRRDDAIFFWVDRTSIWGRVAEGMSWKDAAVNRGVLLRGSTTEIFDARPILGDAATLTAWTGSRLVLVVPETGRAHVLEPFE